MLSQCTIRNIRDYEVDIKDRNSISFNANQLTLIGLIDLTARQEARSPSLSASDWLNQIIDAACYDMSPI